MSKNLKSFQFASVFLDVLENLEEKLLKFSILDKYARLSNIIVETIYPVKANVLGRHLWKKDPNMPKGHAIVVCTL